MHSVASVCDTYCNALTFESLDLEGSFWVHCHNLLAKFIYLGHLVKSQGHRNKKACLFGMGGLPLIQRKSFSFVAFRVLMQLKYNILYNVMYLHYIMYFAHLLLVL